MGISDDSQEYHLYNPKKIKIVINGDVVFEEDKEWNWVKEGEETSMELAQGYLQIGEDEDEHEEEEMVGNDATIEGLNDSITTTIQSNTSKENNLRDALTIHKSTLSRRNIQIPTYLEVYTSGKGLSNEELEVNMVMTRVNDPTIYKEAT